MQKIDYEKLREFDAAPLIELEEQIAEKLRREQEAKLRDEKSEAKKKKKKRARSSS